MDNPRLSVRHLSEDPDSATDTSPFKSLAPWLTCPPDLNDLHSRLDQLSALVAQREATLHRLQQLSSELVCEDEAESTDRALELSGDQQDCSKRLYPPNSIDLQQDSESLQYQLLRTQAALVHKKKTVADLTSVLAVYTDKVNALREEQTQAVEITQELHLQYLTAAQELESLRQKQAEALSDRSSHLQTSNDLLVKRWSEVNREEAGHKKRLKRLEKLKNILKSQHFRKIRVLMKAAIERIIEKKVGKIWFGVISAFETEKAEEIIRKFELLNRENDALLRQSEDLLRYNCSLTRKLQEIEGDKSEIWTPRRQLREKTGVTRGARPAREALAAAGADFLRRTLTMILKNDRRRLLLPSDLPPLWSLSPVALSLLYCKAVTTAEEVARHHPSRRAGKRKSVILALQAMLHTAITKQSSSLVAKRSSEQFHTHFVRPVTMSSEYIDDLLLNVADYEHTAIEATHLTFSKYPTDSWKSLETDIDEARATRYDLTRPALPVSLPTLHTKKRLKTVMTESAATPHREAAFVKEVIAFNKTRHCLSLNNIKTMKEGNGSYLQLTGALRGQLHNLTKRKPIQIGKSEEETERGTRKSGVESTSARSTVNISKTARHRGTATQRAK